MAYLSKVQLFPLYKWKYLFLTLSFSKKLENHISVIWYFIDHYNSSLPVCVLILSFLRLPKI
jgi:hypothetical protein